MFIFRRSLFLGLCTLSNAATVCSCFPNNRIYPISFTQSSPRLNRIFFPPAIFSYWEKGSRPREANLENRGNVEKLEL